MKIFRIIDSRMQRGFIQSKEMSKDSLCWYMLPDSSIVRTDNPWFIPDFDTEFILLPAIAVRIDRLGKSISPKFARRYYNEATLCLTAVAVNTLESLRTGGLPWDKAVSFDKSCMMGTFIPKDKLIQDTSLRFCLGEKTIIPDFSGFVSNIDEIISAVSADNTIKTGDIVVMPINAESLIPHHGDNLTIGGNSGNLLEIRIK